MNSGAGITVIAKVGVLELVEEARLETKSRSCHNAGLCGQNRKDWGLEKQVSS